MDIGCVYFAGGCFWCIQPVFAELDGVISVTSGYSGGSERDAVYESVKSQTTLHRETLKIEFDRDKINEAELFNIFLQNVDPFDKDGQFIDRGRSYTLAVYCEGEKGLYLDRISELEAKSGKTVFISVEDFTGFFSAEEEHQDYYLKNPEEFKEELKKSGRLSYGKDG